MICVPCNLQFRSVTLKECPYCGRALTTKEQPSPREGMTFNTDAVRPVARCKHWNLRPSPSPRASTERQSKRRLRLRAKPNRLISEERLVVAIDALGVHPSLKQVTKGGKIRVTSR